MRDEDMAYFRQRADYESERADRSPDSAVARVHRMMAAHYEAVLLMTEPPPLRLAEVR